jgi:hypothetical protein
VRTGLGWQFDHVIGYFGFAVLFSLAWRRPLVVGGILMVSAMVLEALQALTPDRCCDLQAAFYGVAGALAGAAFADVSAGILKRANGRTGLLPLIWSGWRSPKKIATALLTGPRPAIAPEAT